MRKFFTHPGLIVACIVFVIQLISLPYAGMTWDEPSSFFFGRANLRFWQTLDRKYIEDVKNPELFKGEPFEYIYGEDVYPPFSFLVSSFTSSVLAERLHLMSAIDAHHLGQMLIGVVGVYALYGLCVLFGFSTGISSLVTGIYATYPTIIAQMRNDAKDVPLMSMLVIFLFLFFKWLSAVKKQSSGRHVYGLLAAVALGFAQGTKVSAAIIVPIVGIWFILSYVFFRTFRKQVGNILHRGIEGIVFGLVALAAFIGIWPWLWEDVFVRLKTVFDFFKVVGFGMPTLYFGQVYQAGINLPWHYPLGIFVSQTSPLLLVVFLSGICFAVYRVIRKRDPFALFSLLWLLLGIGRFFVPGVLIYAKIRHYIDAMPSIFLLSGYGSFVVGSVLFSIVKRWPKQLTPRLPSFAVEGKSIHIQKPQYPVIILGFVLLHQILIIATHFPYEPSYFSVFAGGTKHAAEKHLFDVEYWASAVKEGMEAVDAQTIDKTTVYACTMAHLARFYETEKVKVVLSPWEAQYIIIPNSYSWFGGPAEHAKTHHTRIYTVSRMGGPLLWVYKFTSGAFWNCGNETYMNYSFRNSN